MKDKDFIEVSEFVAKQKPSYISLAMLERVSESNSFLMAIQMISQSTEYDLSDATNLHEVYLTLSEKISGIYSTIAELIPYPDIIRILIIRYEFFNLSNAWASYTGKEGFTPIYIEVGDTPTEEYFEFLLHKDPFETTLPDYLLKTAQLAIKRLENGETPDEASSHFITAMFAEMQRLAEKVDNNFISDIVETMIDFYNSYALIKTKTDSKDISSLESILVEGGKSQKSFFVSGYTKPLAAAIPAYYHKQYSANITFAIDKFERTEDFTYISSLFHILISKTSQKVKLVSYGAEVPFAYLLEIENEIFEIKTILKSILAEKPASIITDYLQLNIK